jgi:hypothetical protein
MYSVIYFVAKFTLKRTSFYLTSPNLPKFCPNEFYLKSRVLLLQIHSTFKRLKGENVETLNAAQFEARH